MLNETASNLIVAAAAQSATCAACGSSDTRIFWRSENRTLRRCSSCRLLFVFPQPQREELHQGFQSSYFGANSDGRKNRLELEFESWRRPVLARITKKIREAKPSGTLLDVGCASGELFNYFLDGKWKLLGLEPSALAAERGRERFAGNPSVQISNAYLCDWKADEPFDVITVLESLFYMPNPNRELGYIAQNLKDDGVLVIATPGFEYQRLRHTGLISYVLYRSRCTLTSSHLFYFSRKSLTAVLKSHGFRITQVVPLGSSEYGGALGRRARNLYVTFGRAISALTLGHVNLSPHVLYICRKSAVASK